MKEAFEKIIERLEKRIGDINFYKATHECNESYYCGETYAYAHAIEIVNKVAEEFGSDINVGSKELDSLHQKILKSKFAEEVTEAEIDALVKAKNNSNDGWIPCSVGLPKAHIEVWITYKWDDGSIHVDRDRVIHGEWYCTKRETVIAWKYMKVPTPYAPKGEE